MNKYDILLIVTVLVTHIITFVLGYVVGQLLSISGVSYYSQKTEKNNLTKNIKTIIPIDSTKIVTNISTSGIEKKYTELGDVKKSEENITSSIDKLKNMKG